MPFCTGWKKQAERVLGGFKVVEDENSNGMLEMRHALTNLGKWSNAPLTF